MERGKKLLKIAAVFALALASGLAAQEIPQLVQQLGNDDPDVREAAQTSLEKLPNTATPEIEKFFDDQNPEIRRRVRSILRVKDSIIFLTTDMAKDDIPGNAERARKIIFRRYEAERDRFLPHILRMVESSDVQQSFYGAFILISKGDASEIDRAFPDFWKTAINNFCHSMPAGIEWLATRVVLHYCCSRPSRDIDAAFEETIGSMEKRAWSLNELAWYMLDEIFVRYPQLYMRWSEENFSMKQWMSEVGVHYPERLIRIAVHFDGCDCTLIRRLGDFAVPVLKDELMGEHRKSAAKRLIALGYGIETPKLLNTAAEFVDDGSLNRFLLDVGKEALPALKETLYRSDISRRLDAAELIATIDKTFEQQKVIDTTIESFYSSNIPGFSKRALDVIVSVGEPAVNALNAALGSGDPQTVVFSLAALGQLGHSSHAVELKGVLNSIENENIGIFHSDIVRWAWRALGESKITLKPKTK